MTSQVQTDRPSNAWGTAATEMQFNTCFCFSTKIFSPTGFLIQCMTSRQRVLKVFRQRSSSFRSGQWQMSRRGRSKTACPGKTTELWSACRGELLLRWGEGTSACNIISSLQNGTLLSKAATNYSMHYVQLNSRRSLYTGSLSCLILCLKHTVDLNWQLLSQEALGSIPCARGNHLCANTVLFCTWMEKKTGWSAQITVHRFGE